MTRCRFVTPILFAVSLSVAPAPVVGLASAAELPPIGCEATDRIDGSTAADARKKSMRPALAR